MFNPLYHYPGPLHLQAPITHKNTIRDGADDLKFIFCTTSSWDQQIHSLTHSKLHSIELFNSANWNYKFIHLFSGEWGKGWCFMQELRWIHIIKSQQSQKISHYPAFCTSKITTFCFTDLTRMSTSLNIIICSWTAWLCSFTRFNQHQSLLIPKPTRMDQHKNQPNF